MPFGLVLRQTRAASGLKFTPNREVPLAPFDPHRNLEADRTQERIHFIRFQELS